VESGSKIPVSIAPGNYSITFYGTGNLNAYSYNSAGVGKFLGRIEATAAGTNFAVANVSEASTGFAFSGANGTVVIRRFITATSATISDTTARPKVSGLPSNSLFYTGRVAYSGSRWVVISANSTSYSAYSDDGIFWTYSQNMPVSTVWADITYGNGLFVAIAGASWFTSTVGNAVATSPDGVTWTQRTVPNGYWGGITFGNGTFVAVNGGNATTSTMAVYSTDAITWTQSTLPANVSWTDVEYGSNKFVAISNSSSFATSTDGITWVARTAATSATWRKIVWTGTRFVVLGSYASNTQLSSDGITWSNGQALSQNASYVHHSMEYVNGVLIASNESLNLISYSTNNGDSWTAVSTPNNNYTSFIWNGSTYIAINNNGAATASSTNLTTWAVLGTGLSQNSSMFYVNGTFVALQSGSSNISVSTNGTSWTLRNVGYSFNWYTMMYGNGLYLLMAGSDGSNNYQGYLTSPDLITWTYRNLPVAQFWKRGIFANGRFIMPSSGNGTPQNAYSSSDGINWTVSTISVYGAVLGQGDGKVVALPLLQHNEGSISYDGGLTWTPFVLPISTAFSSIAFGNGIFVAAASGWATGGGPIWTSTDGVTWIKSSLSTTIYVNTQISFSNGYFAFSYSQDVYTSTNGRTWAKNPTPGKTFQASAGGPNGIVMGDGGSAGIALIRSSVTIS
jgi:hypothetical protein